MTGPAAGSEGGTDVQAQIHSLQMGQRGLLQMAVQGAVVGGQQIDLVTQAVVVHGNDLPCLTGHKTVQTGQLLMQLDLLDHAVGQILEILQGACGVLVGACQKQSVQLALGSGDGQNFNDVFVISTLLDRGAATHAVMAADGIAHLEAVQQGRDESLL